MKTRLLPAALLLAVLPAFGQDQPYFASYQLHLHTDLDRAVTSYMICLESPNAGVVESGLAHIGRMKLYFPGREFPGLASAVQRVASEGATPELRYRAYLISTLFSCPAASAMTDRRDFSSPDELFGAIAEQLQHTLLSSASGR